MYLNEMKQDDLLQWIDSIPEDASFSSAIKKKIKDGIIAYSKAENSEITGTDFVDAEDANDIVELCNIPKRNARQLLAKISDKKTADFNKKKKEKGAVPTGAPETGGSSNIITFDLNITAMRGKMYKIKNVTKNTTIADVKAKFLRELGDDAAADQYQGMLAKWNKKGGKIEMKKGGNNMKDNKTLGDYDILNGIHLPLVVSFKVIGGAYDDSKDQKINDDDDDDKYRNRKLRRKKHKGVIKFTNKPDCIMDYTDEDGIKRAEMPCGCAYASDTMYRHMKSLFEGDFGEAKAVCPMPKKTHCKGSDKERRWPWALVFIIADLSEKEVIRYTKAIENRLSGSKSCPHCGANTERPDDLRISRVRCKVCDKSDWCWNCTKVWNHGGLGPICGNDNCMGQQLNNMLKMENCGKVAAPWSDIKNTGKDIPKSRACTKCYTVLEYTEACKHIYCICCPHEFCFNCLRDWKSGDCSHGKTCEFTPVQQFK